MSMNKGGGTTHQQKRSSRLASDIFHFLSIWIHFLFSVIVWHLKQEVWFIIWKHLQNILETCLLKKKEGAKISYNVCQSWESHLEDIVAKFDSFLIHHEWIKIFLPSFPGQHNTLQIDGTRWWTWCNPSSLSRHRIIFPFLSIFLLN